MEAGRKPGSLKNCRLCGRGKNKRVARGSSLQERTRLCRKKRIKQRGSRSLLHGVARCFEDQTGQVEGQRESITEEHGFSGVGEAKGGGTFKMPASLGRIAALGIRLSAHS